MMNLFKRILSYARPLSRYWPPYLVLSIISLIFGVINYALLGPLLTVLFDSNAAGTGFPKPEFQMTLDYFTGAFKWYLSDIITRGGIVKGLSFSFFLFISLTNFSRPF